MLLLLLAAALAAPDIAPRPLPFDVERVRLTLAYQAAHRGAEALTGDAVTDVSMAPRVIVLHWTAGATADSAWNTFAPSRLSGRADLDDAGALNVSAHFLVDRDGSIAQLMPTDRIGRHVIGLNHVAIGIENVGDGQRWPLTTAQIDANAALVRHLVELHPTITHLIGHHEYRQLEGHPYFQELDPNYRTVKPDPGRDFMAGVRAQVGDLGLEGP